MTYYKVCKVGGAPLYNGNEPRLIDYIEESILDTDSSKLCATGIYFCRADQLPLWWQNYETEIREVEPLGEIITVSKGFRTGKLKHIRVLTKKEIVLLGNNNSFDYANCTQTAGDRSTQTAGDESIQTAGDRSTQTTGYESTQTAGDGSTQTAGDESIQTAGDRSTQTTGYGSTQTAGDGSTQTAGDRSTQTAGDESIQTAGDGSTQIIRGDHSYIILKGRNVLLRQIWWGSGWQSAIINHDDIFAAGFQEGDKIEVIKGKWAKIS